MGLLLPRVLLLFALLLGFGLLFRPVGGLRSGAAAIARERLHKTKTIESPPACGTPVGYYHHRYQHKCPTFAKIQPPPPQESWRLLSLLLFQSAGGDGGGGGDDAAAAAAESLAESSGNTATAAMESGASSTSSISSSSSSSSSAEFVNDAGEVGEASSVVAGESFSSKEVVVVVATDAAPPLLHDDSAGSHQGQGQGQTSSRRQEQEMSRREWFQKTKRLLVAGTLLGGAAAAAVMQYKSVPAAPPRLASVNITKVVQETAINVTLETPSGCISLDATTLAKKSTWKLPRWVPPSFVPPPRVIRDVTDGELAIAAILAGSVVEMGRTLLLYPLLTLKTRIQTDVKHSSTTSSRRRWRRRRLEEDEEEEEEEEEEEDEDEDDNADAPPLPVLLLSLLTTRFQMARHHYAKGNLYAGIVPSLLVSVPATGVYYSVRDVTRRGLTAPLAKNEVAVALTAALIADVASLMVRTPSDTLAMRLQTVSGRKGSRRDEDDDDNNDDDKDDKEEDENDDKDDWNDHKQDDKENEKDDEHHNHEVMNKHHQSQQHHHDNDHDDEPKLHLDYYDKQVGDWFAESLQRLPAVILTDLPYLLSRIALNRMILGGAVLDLGQYETVVIGTAIFCGLLTTPFDVARTRILVDSDGDPSNGMDGGSGEGLLCTFQGLYQEGGIPSLFAGWMERTAYLGIGRAWLEPLQILGYIAIRDAILLQWFD